ncbi:MAG: hypothetical protein U9N53_12955, partial [Bacteroidota bacterium]|nr:hypothetical protein [Bacteroidota bacterium]
LSESFKKNSNVLRKRCKGLNKRWLENIIGSEPVPSYVEGLHPALQKSKFQTSKSKIMWN